MERIEAAAVRQLFRGCRYTNKHLDRQTTLFIGPYNLSSYSFNVGLIGLDDGGGGNCLYIMPRYTGTRKSTKCEIHIAQRDSSR